VSAPDVLDTVRDHIAAFNDRDLERVLATFGEDAVFATTDQLVIGRRGLRALFGDSFAQSVGAALELRRAVVDGDTAACELVEHLALPGGGTADVDVAAFYTVRGGLLARVRVYRDLAGGEG
jgi:uncharacterized protein (TIGR02246 family)